MKFLTQTPPGEASLAAAGETSTQGRLSHSALKPKLRRNTSQPLSSLKTGAFNHIYIQRKLSLRESATTNKFWTAWEMLQPMLRQIGWHCILAKICSQRISFQRRSRLNQCTSSITQHVTPACYSTLRHSITYLHAIRGYPLFHTQKEIDDGAILLKKLYVSRSSNIQWWHAKGIQRASVLLHCMIWPKWRRFPNQLAL